jgi:predicted PurR-regulated permease PerM
MPVLIPPTPGAGAGGDWRAEIPFLRRVLIVAAVAVLMLLAWWVREALLLAFGGVVVATLLLATARPFERHAGLPRRWSLPAAGVLLLAVLGLAGVLVGGEVRAQLSQLGAALPQAVEQLERRFRIEVPPLAREAAGMATREDAATPPPGEERGVDVAMVGSAMRRIAGFGTVVLDAVAAVLLAVVTGAFLAADPGGYRRGLARLLPRSQQARAEDALETSGRALHQWLRATLLGMAIIGTLAGAGSWALGLPAPLAIGIFAGLCEFVPVIGSILGAVPALLLALTLGTDTFLWTLLLFVAIQQLESNVIMPLVQQRLVSVPPAVMLLSVVAFGAVLGLPGVVLAAPLTVVSFVIVTKLYVRETLGQPAVVPGEGDQRG